MAYNNSKRKSTGAVNLDTQEYTIKNEICRKQTMEVLSSITDSEQLQSYSTILSELLGLGLDFIDILDIFHFMEFKKQNR